MAKKVVVKGGKQLKKKVEKQREADKDSLPHEDAGSMDFGGIPARDLKKNLGCG